MKKCKKCGCDLPSRRPKFCSKECHLDYLYIGRTRIEKCVCAICYKEFIKLNKKHICCSRLCSDLYYSLVTKDIEKTKKNRRKYEKKRRQEDKTYRISKSMSIMIWQALKNGRIFKSWDKYLSYSVDELKAHLENQFREGMYWDNYGEWHIDHIKPRSSFKYESENDIEFKECWKLENLQPLWASENMYKGNI